MWHFWFNNPHATHYTEEANFPSCSHWGYNSAQGEQKSVQDNENLQWKTYGTSIKSLLRFFPSSAFLF